MYCFRNCESELRLLECDILLLEAGEEISQVTILTLGLLVFRLERCDLVFQILDMLFFALTERSLGGAILLLAFQ